MKVIILSGIPGAGKSTFTKTLSRQIVVSADHFFLNNKGEYNFDFRKLSEAHGSCLKQFTNLIVSGELDDFDYLVVDNTNTSVLEIAPYVALANAYGLECELVTIECDPEIAANRNVHGVPLDACKRMANNMKARTLPPFWTVKQTVIKVSL